jgi:hypothetical protein
MNEAAQKPDDVAGKIFGIAMFVAGIVLLSLVFAWSYRMFNVWGDKNIAKAGMTESLVGGGIQLGLLFVMAYVASLIATKGLQLYGVCRGVSPR